MTCDSSRMEDPPPPEEVVPRRDPAERQSGLGLRSLWKNASWTSGSVAVSTVLLVLETVLVARFLGAAGLGHFVLVRAYPEAVQQLLDCRTRETIVKYLGEYVALGDRERGGGVVRLIWVVDAAAGLAALLIVLVTAPLAARYVAHDPAAAGLIALYALSQFVGTLDSASGSVVRVFDRFGVASAMGVSRATARFLAMLAALLLGGGVAALISVLVLVEVVYTVAAAYVGLSLLRRRIGFRVLGPIGDLGGRRREVLTFLLNTNIAGTLKMSSEKLVLVIVGVLGGTSVAAQYKVASQFGSALMLFSDPFYQVVYPTLSRMTALREWDAVFGGLRRLQRTTLAFALPAAVVASGLMVPAIPLVFGGEFRPAVIPAIVILWGVLPNVAFFWLRPLLLSLGEAERLVRYRAVASGIQLVAALALVGPAGALGAAVSLLIMQWLYAFLEVRLVRARSLRVLDGVGAA